MSIVRGIRPVSWRGTGRALCIAHDWSLEVVGEERVYVATAAELAGPWEAVTSDGVTVVTGDDDE